MESVRSASLNVRAAQLTDAESISGVVDSLRFTNAADYPPEIIDRVAENFSPTCVKDLMGKRRVLVALMGARIVGTASLDGATVKTVFVAPDVQRRGIGAKLMDEIDHIAREIGLGALTLASSVTAEAFYTRLGFVAVRDSYYGDERTIIMERRLQGRCL